MNLISFTDKGLYCEAGDFYVDPWKPVDRAIITHGHSDHAYSGHKYYLCHHYTKPILQLRLGDNNYQSVEWGETILINNVKVSLHPAGHIIGSSQIRVEHKNEVWVVSGDYKTEDDGLSGKFEPIKCNTFITESTFGLPIYSWKPQHQIFERIINWIAGNRENGKTSVLLAYSLGKAQRVLQHIKETTQTIYAHGAIYNTQQTLINAGWKLPEIVRVTPETSKELLKGTIVIAPPSADGSPWMRKFSPYSVGVCSGWMQVRGNVRRRNVDAGFALSDHADWNGLLQTIKATGAERVFVTHGFQHAFSRYLNEQNIAIAAEVKTEYGTEDEEAAPVQQEENAVADINDMQNLPEVTTELTNMPEEEQMGNEDDIVAQSGNGLAMFAALVTQISSSTKTNDKLEVLAEYFTLAGDKDKVWVIAIFSGRRPKRIVNSTLLSEWCMALASLPPWLFLECYSTVGDLGDTIALLLPEAVHNKGHKESLSHFLEKFIEIEKQDEAIRKKFVLDSWDQMNTNERFVFNKLITGNFRIGVSQKMMVNALSKIVDLSASVIAHRISGNWDPVTTGFSQLLSEDAVSSDDSKPYPFYLAYALEEEPATLGSPSEWQAEWKWDGIRGQIIKRNNELYVWSRGEELMTEKFPEYSILKHLLPEGVVVDGEIIPAEDGKPLPFAVLQTRIGRKNITKKQLLDAPICFFAYDLLEYDGQDWRARTLIERREQLEKILAPIGVSSIQLSEVIPFSDWHQLADVRRTSREMNSEGIMLKRKNSTYQVGRKRGDWWKWKIDALTIDCVMVYAQKGSGRRSNLYTDYTFAVKDGDKLVTFTKAYSGLTDKEFGQVDNFVKRNSIEKFGPVRTVKPELVFEIAFEGIAASNRHKSGVALRFPRISRWRKDKKVDEINTIEDLKAMLKMYGK